MTLATVDVSIRDVGPRDGLQSVAASPAAAVKATLVSRLAAAGIPRIEAGSFVSPTAVLQMADSDEVFSNVERRPGSALEALVLDERGTRRAIEARPDALVTVVAASDTFSRRNVRRSTREALDTAINIRALAQQAGLDTVVDIATSFGCAYEGPVPVARVASVAWDLARAGFTEITLADTTGMATPTAVTRVVAAVVAQVGPDVRIGLHFHNTRGLGLVNVMSGLDAGVRLFDASIGGIGGCPFSPGATGNICTEDLVNLLHSLRLETGTDLPALVGAARWLEGELGFALPGQLMRTSAAGSADLATAS